MKPHPADQSTILFLLVCLIDDTKKGPVDLDKSREVCSFRCANLKRTKMLLTKEQISEQMRKHAEKKNGLHDLMEIMLESMMVAERGEYDPITHTFKGRQ